MSVHGACFDNGQSGRCAIDLCEEYQEGRCPIPYEMEEHYSVANQAVILDEAIGILAQQLTDDTERHHITAHFLQEHLWRHGI